MCILCHFYAIKLHQNKKKTFFIRKKVIKFHFSNFQIFKIYFWFKNSYKNQTYRAQWSNWNAIWISYMELCLAGVQILKISFNAYATHFSHQFPVFAHSFLFYCINLLFHVIVLRQNMCVLVGQLGNDWVDFHYILLVKN